MSNEQKPQNRLEIELDAEVAQGQYSSLVVITHSTSEFVLDFAEMLPGMPKEYHPYVDLLEDETSDGIAKMLTEVLSNSDEILFQKGVEARRFVLEQKNNVIQAQKILEMLKT